MNLSIDEFLAIPPYALKNHEIEELQSDHFSKLTTWHYENSVPYRRMLNVLGFENLLYRDTTSVPFLPVSIFKEADLVSVPIDEIKKSMTSSGTTGQRVSKIYLDNQTSSNQIKALSKIVSAEIGQKRLPLIILDSEDVIKNREKFSARGAGILGFSMFGQERIFALDSDMNLNHLELEKFIKKYNDSKILLFGFTFMVWQHFLSELKKSKSKLNLSNGTLIHGGGWKKLIQEGISNSDLKKSLKLNAGITKVSDYYGMVEQTGSIFMECKAGFMHSNVFNNIHVRDFKNFELSEMGTEGIIQVMSVLPFSYPGHSILTEDLGTIFGIDDCPCGQNGKRFRVHGRVKNAEIRGCSDTYASEF